MAEMAKEEVKQPLYRVVAPNQDQTFEARFKQNFEAKDYLVCINLDWIETEPVWSICHGRTETYEYIKDNIMCAHGYAGGGSHGEIYLSTTEAFVLVDGLPLKDRKSIYAFMKYVQQFYDDGFNIDDYVDLNILVQESDDESEAHQVAPHEIYQILDSGISMEEFMGGQRYLKGPVL